MKKLILLLATCASLAFGQATMTTTTLSSAMTATQATAIPAAMTGITDPVNQIANNGMGNPSGTGIVLLYVDKELMRVNRVNTTTAFVSRGWGGTASTSHAASAVVYVGPSEYFASVNPAGSCTSTLLTVLPRVVPPTGRIYTCLSSGQWIWTGDGTMNSAPAERVSNFCTGTAGSAETEFLNGAACSGATTATARQVISSPGVLANLRVFSSAAFTGGTNKDVITVVKNGSGTTITCTAAGAATTCSDSTHSVAVVAGDVITFSFVSATSDTAANVSANVEKY